jgi:hypothetical protein
MNYRAVERRSRKWRKEGENGRQGAEREGVLERPAI